MQRTLKNRLSQWLPGTKKKGGASLGAPFLVYNMSKVGSSTIYKTLAEEHGQDQVFHFHYLTNNFLDLRNTRHPMIELSLRMVQPYLDFQEKWPSLKPFIVTAVRDPMAHFLSGIFQNAAVYGQRIPELHELTEKLKVWQADYGAIWLDYELKESFGLDFLGQPFDKDKGYTILENEKARGLCLRLENMNEVFSEAYAQLINGPSLNLKEAENLASEKKSGDLYRQYKKQLKFPEQFLREYYRQQFPRHFYSCSEIETFINRWKA